MADLKKYVMNKGKIELILFPFTDLSGSKLMLAIILAVNKLDIM